MMQWTLKEFHFDRIVQVCLMGYLFVFSIPHTAALRSILLGIMMIVMVIKGISTRKFPVVSKSFNIIILLLAALTLLKVVTSIDPDYSFKFFLNEFLKQVPLLKRHGKKILLVCATNYIGQLDAALLRPGRFDCIIPVGVLEPQARKIIFEHYLGRTNRGEVDVDKIVSMIPLFTPADIEYLFQKVSQSVFEREYMLGTDYRVTTDIFTEIIPTVRTTLTDEIIQEFQQDEIDYTRY